MGLFGGSGDNKGMTRFWQMLAETGSGLGQGMTTSAALGGAVAKMGEEKNAAPENEKLANAEGGTGSGSMGGAGASFGTASPGGGIITSTKRTNDGGSAFGSENFIDGTTRGKGWTAHGGGGGDRFDPPNRGEIQGNGFEVFGGFEPTTRLPDAPMPKPGYDLNGFPIISDTGGSGSGGGGGGGQSKKLSGIGGTGAANKGNTTQDELIPGQQQYGLKLDNGSESMDSFWNRFLV